jgi:hypothetical protein
MTLDQKIGDHLQQAIKARDGLRTSCLRMARAAIKNAQVEKGRALTDEEVQGVLASLIKKGKDAAKEFRDGRREDLALKEEAEIQIFYEYLPQQLSPDEVEAIVREIISQLPARGPNDLGKVMKAAMGRMAGRAQGKEVNEIARRLLQTT